MLQIIWMLPKRLPVIHLRMSLSLEDPIPMALPRRGYFLYMHLKCEGKVIG